MNVHKFVYNLLFKVTEYNIRRYVIQWRIPTITKVIVYIFKLADTVAEILSFEMFDLKNLGQGRGEQHAQ